MIADKADSSFPVHVGCARTHIYVAVFASAMINAILISAMLYLVRAQRHIDFVPSTYTVTHVSETRAEEEPLSEVVEPKELMAEYTVNLDMPTKLKREQPRLKLDASIHDIKSTIIVNIPDPATKDASFGESGDADGNKGGSGNRSSTSVATDTVKPDDVATLESHQVDEPPLEVYTPQPKYPEVALKRGSEGFIKVRIFIDTDGRVKDVCIVESTGHISFCNAVLEVVKSWRFSPAKNKGISVRVWASKTIHFKLEN